MRINQFLAEMGGEAPISARYSQTGARGGCASSPSCASAPAGASRGQRGCERGAGCGSLPNPASIAMAYTPMQQPNGCMFDPEQALKRGTLFSGLELPLGGDFRVGNLPACALSDVQAITFATHELALYLDTHPCDADALQLYNQYQRAANEKQAEFSRTHYPLTRACNTNNSENYAWVCDPWPWQLHGTGKENR